MDKPMDKPWVVTTRLAKVLGRGKIIHTITSRQGDRYDFPHDENESCGLCELGALPTKQEK